MKTIADIPDVPVSESGLRRKTDGYIDWLEDSSGNHYDAPLWLLQLLGIHERLGAKQMQMHIASAFGLSEFATNPLLPRTVVGNGPLDLLD